MKRTFALAAAFSAVACSVALLAGCAGSSNSSNAGSVACDGSTSMEKVIGVLGESYREQNPDVTFTFNPTGSGSGIKAVQEGRCDIGLSSRNLKDEEKAQGLKETVLALDGIAVITNPNNPVSNLTLDEVNAIFTGKVTNWKELGGSDKPIVIIGREAGSGTRDGFESITNTKDNCTYRQELTSTGDVITAVAQNEGAIGYASLASVKDTVKKVDIEGVTATDQSVRTGEYKIQRPFILVTKENTPLSPSAQGFFDYATSAEVAFLINNAGAIAVA